MIKMDMSEPQSPVWENITIPDHIAPRVQAEAVWIPVAEAGVIVLIGGVTFIESLIQDDILSVEQQTESQRVSPGFMTTVSVYDVAGDTW